MMRIAALSVFLLVSNAALADECSGNTMCEARRGEPALLHPDRAVRQGNALILHLADAKHTALQDHAKGCEHERGECGSYALMADVPRAHAFVVQKFYGEGSDYFLIDDRTGKQIELHGMPVFSPDGAEYLVAPYDISGGTTDNDMEIWRRADDSAVLEWAHTFHQAYAEDPTLKQLYETRVARWNKDKITLALSEPGTGRRWTGSLTRDGGGWHLSAKSP
jgi:hypothetical protein